MTFEEYLLSKKIDVDLFRKGDAARFEQWKNLFEQVHPESFTLQKKFLLNPIRRKYQLK